MRVLGLDPGSRRTGYGVVERDGSEFRALAHGVFAPPARLDLAHRHLDGGECRGAEQHEADRPDGSSRNVPEPRPGYGGKHDRQTG